jgi:hypothetical protein
MLRRVKSVISKTVKKSLINSHMLTKTIKYQSSSVIFIVIPLPALNTGIAAASFHRAGKISVVMLKLKIDLDGLRCFIALLI